MSDRSAMRVKLRAMRKLRLLLGFLACLLPWPLVAAPELFTAETVVADEGSETRNTALSGMLADVLVRASGNVAIAGQPAAGDLLDAAPSLVQQYRYRTAERDGEVVRYLWARFDRAAVERMMRERQLPVWSQRPTVLLWAATEQGGRRTLLNLDNHPNARQALLARAAERGMSLQLPLMDLEDQAQLTPADVWADYRDAIRSASFRYPHDVVLTGRLRTQGGGKWTGTWSMIDGDSVQTFRTSPQGLGETLAFAADQAQNLLAARYAPMHGGGGSGTLVAFADVYDLAAYGRLVAFLDGIDVATQVALRYVDGDRFLFEFQVRGGGDDLARALEAGGLLVAESPPLRPAMPPPAAGPGTPTDTAAAAPAPEADLHYRLIN